MMYSSDLQDLFDIDDILRSEFLESGGGSNGERSSVRVSPTFHPGADLGSVPSNLTIRSSDGILFYVHNEQLQQASDNAFKGHLPTSSGTGLAAVGSVLELLESSRTVDLILRTVYGLPFPLMFVPLDDLSSVLNTMAEWGIQPQLFISHSCPLYYTLLSFASTKPLELYALAASHGLHELAVAASEYLLSLDLTSISDNTTDKIGAVYLKHLFLLHQARTEALKRLLLTSPEPHQPTWSCNTDEQKRLVRAWALASAYLAWDARPDASSSTMEQTLIGLREQLSCDLCIASLRRRIQKLIAQWALVKRTI